MGTLSTRVQELLVNQQTSQLVSINNITTAVPNTNATSSMAPPVPPAWLIVLALQAVTTQTVALQTSHTLPVTSTVTSTESVPSVVPEATAAVTSKSSDIAVASPKQDTSTITAQAVQPDPTAPTFTNAYTQKVSVVNNDVTITSTIIVVKQPQTNKP